MQTTLKTKIGLFIAIPIYIAIVSVGLIIAVSAIILIKTFQFFGVIDAMLYLLKKTETYAKKWQIGFSMRSDNFMSKK